MTCKLPQHSPWGAIVTATVHRAPDGGATGLIFVETASHGGFWVPPELRGHIPAPLTAATFNGLGTRGWYEEDCDASIVINCFPRWFPEAQVIDACIFVMTHHAPKVVDVNLRARALGRR